MVIFAVHCGHLIYSEETIIITVRGVLQLAHESEKNVTIAAVLLFYKLEKMWNSKQQNQIDKIGVNFKGCLIGF